MNGDAQEFRHAVMEACQQAEDILGHRFSRFRQMVEEAGQDNFLEVCVEIVLEEEPPRGYVELVLNNLRHLSIEAFVVQPHFDHLFEQHVIDAARRRLGDDYNVPEA